MTTSNQPSRKKSAIFIILALLLTGGAIAARYFLFTHGILYGENASQMASLAVAGIIVVAGYVPLRILRGSSNAVSGARTESIAATIAAILGLAVTAYSVSQLFVPNTPIQASAPACAGTPVYGARFLAKTMNIGVNARSGPGRQYAQVSRYEGNCTLGFDGYCIGSAEPDFVLNTPDQRWLLVHNRNQLIASAVVLSESPEANLGTEPDSNCPKLGGLPQPQSITQFSYKTTSGQLTATAPGAVAIGYGLAAAGENYPIYHIVALGTDPSSSFTARLQPTALVDDVQTTNGQVWLGAAICLADNVPVVDSLYALRLTIHNSVITRQIADSIIPINVKSKLAEIACNSSG